MARAATALGAPQQLNGSGPQGLKPKAPSATGSRSRVMRVVAGALVVVLCVIGFGVAWATAGARRGVIALARTVLPGQVISAGDLERVGVSADPSLAPIPWGQATAVIGRRMAYTAVQGSLLITAELATGDFVPAGSSVEGLSLPAGRYPYGLLAGDRVAIVEVPPGSAPLAVPMAPVRPQVVLATATVQVVAGSANSNSVVVDLVVTNAQAALVATAAAAGQVTLVELGPAAQ